MTTQDAKMLAREALQYFQSLRIPIDDLIEDVHASLEGMLLYNDKEMLKRNVGKVT